DSQDVFGASTAEGGIDVSAALGQLKDAGVSADINSVTLHQVHDADGNAVADSFVLKAGDEYFAVQFALGSAAGDSDTVSIAAVDGTYADNDGTGKAVTSLLKVSYDADGDVATYATVEGSNYAAGAAAGTTGYADATVAIDISDAAATPTAQFTGMATA